MVLKKSILTIQVRQVLKLFLCLLTDERNYIEIFYSVFILKTLGDRFVLCFISGRKFCANSDLILKYKAGKNTQLFTFIF